MKRMEEKELYKVSNWEVFQRNFLVGFSRALGGLVIQIVFFAIIYFSIVQFLWPTFEPLFSRFQPRDESSTQNQGWRNFMMF